MRLLSVSLAPALLAAIALLNSVQVQVQVQAGPTTRSPSSWGPRSHLINRQANSTDPSSSSSSPLDPQSYLASKFKHGDPIPGARPGDAPGQVAILQGQDASENSQSPYCYNTVFIGSAQVNGSQQQGWQELPQVLGFDLKRDLHVGTDKKGGILPYYIETGKDLTKVKRVIIIQSGKPRDSWKYSSLVRNSLLCAANNQTQNVNLNEILIVSPAWQSNLEQQAGAVEPGSLYFGTGSWAQGRLSRGNSTVSSFRAFDQLVDLFFDKSKYPALNTVLLAGHSLGCSFTQRYAVLRKPNENDPNLRFWYANCGSYTWPSTDRPIKPGEGQCPSQGYDDWPYGLSAGIPIYANRTFNRNETIQRFFQRKAYHALGADDDGPGDTHAEAQCQGTGHLSRGLNLETAFKAFQPNNFTLDVLPNISHVDYLMLSHPTTQYRLFTQDLDDRVEVSGNSNNSGSKGTSPNSSSSSHSGSIGRIGYLNVNTILVTMVLAVTLGVTVLI